jgi:hypothetical protein
MDENNTIILPQVDIVNSVSESANLLIENNGSIKRFPFSEIDDVSSWNDLKDKPFGETPGMTNTLTWDGTPTEASYEITYFTLYKISDSVPSIEDIEKGYTVTTFDGYSYIRDDTEIDERGIILLPSSNNPWAMVVPTDLEDLPKGTYLSYMEHGYQSDYITSLTLLDNVFEVENVNTIESKYMPKYLQPKETVIKTDTLTWDGVDDDNYNNLNYYKVSEAVPTMEDLANGYVIEFSDGITYTEEDYSPYFDEENGYIELMYECRIYVIDYTDVYGQYWPKGIYFMAVNSNYVKSLKITGYTFEIKEIKLNKKYLPIPTADEVGAVTEAQVTTMINNALGVIENGSY